MSGQERDEVSLLWFDAPQTGRRRQRLCATEIDCASARENVLSSAEQELGLP